MRTLARFALRRPKLTLALWVCTIAFLSIPGASIDDKLAQATLDLPGTESHRAAQLEREHFPDDSIVPVLLKGPRADVERQGKRLVRELRRRDDVRVLSPFEAGKGRNALRPSPEAALVVVEIRPPEGEVFYVVAPEVEKVVDRVVKSPVRAHVTGSAAIGKALNEASLEAAKKAEMIAIPVLILVLLIVFRSPLAALIPGLVGLATVSASFGGIALLASVMSIDAIATSLASMMGLALGVDYSLLTVSRFREEIARGADPLAAARTAAGTAGRTVVFAGGVLIAAMLVALYLSPGTILLSGAVGVITAAVLSVGTAVAAIPAALVLLGPNIDRWRIGRPSSTERTGRFDRLMELALRRPLIAATLIGVGLILLASPVLRFETGPSSIALLPPDSKARKDFEALRETMGPGWTNPFNVVVVARSGTAADDKRLRKIARFERELADDPRVASVVGPGEIREATRSLEKVPAQLRRAGSDMKRGRKGLGELKSGLTRAQGGIEDLRSGLATASNGAGQLRDGSSRGRAGASDLASGARTARDGSTELSAGLTRARRGANQILSGVRTARGGARRLERELRQARTRVLEEATPGAEQLASELARGSQDLAKLREPAQVAQNELDAAMADLQAMSAGKLDPKYADALRHVATAKGAVSGKHPLTGAPVAEGYDGLDAEIAGGESELNRAAGGASRLADGTRELADGLGQLADGGQRLDTGLGQLERAQAELVSGLKTLRAGSGDLNGGLTRLAAGATQLEQGLVQLDTGAGNLATGLDDGYRRSSPLETRLGEAGAPIERFRRQLAGSGGFGQFGRRSPKIFDSGYFVLAALDGSRARDRNRASLGISVDNGGRAARLLVIPTGGPNEKRTAELRDTLADRASALGRATDSDTAVGGIGAQLVDYDRVTSARLPILIIALALITYVVLVPVLRTLVLPLVAVLLNLLTVAASFGVIAVLFGGETPPLGGPGFMDVVAISGVFTVIFGLSIDYQVFLLSRMREGWARSGDNESAIRYGLGRTAKVITGAAAIMAAVFLANSFSDFTSVRQFGVGLTVAVVLDAIVVRLLLLPAVMKLLGAWTWWLPAWLDRGLPRLDVEGLDHDGGRGRVEPAPTTA